MQKRFVIDHDELRRLYLVDGLGIRPIAKRLGTSTATVARNLRAAGIERREIGPDSPANTAAARQVDIADIIRLYVDERLSAFEVGARVGLCEGTVRLRLERAGIPRRSTTAWMRPAA